MQIIRSDNLACPLDGHPLRYTKQSVVCANGHSFDLAKVGYVNLMPVQHKKTKDPGDSKDMVAARTAFLNTGVYQPISDRLNNLTEKYFASNAVLNILDAGCGDGYYLCRYIESLTGWDNLLTVNPMGMDISKWACHAAAKRNNSITWVVASNRHPPILPDTVDVIFCMFGFSQFATFRKLLKPGGIVVLVDPAERHLLELRKIIYPTVKTSLVACLEPATEAGFKLLESSSETYGVELTTKQIQDLLMMTPHMFRASSTGKADAVSLRKLDITVDVTFRVLSL